MSAEIQKKMKIKFPMKAEIMLLGILPDNIEKISEDLFRYKITEARVILATEWKTEENAQVENTGKINWLNIQ